MGVVVGEVLEGKSGVELIIGKGKIRRKCERGECKKGRHKYKGTRNVDTLRR